MGKEVEEDEEEEGGEEISEAASTSVIAVAACSDAAVSRALHRCGTSARDMIFSGGCSLKRARSSPV